VLNPAEIKGVAVPTAGSDRDDIFSEDEVNWNRYQAF